MHKSIGISLGTLAILATPALAERGRNPLAGQPAIRHRVEMRKLRFEISPNLLLSLNHPYLIGVGGGANLQFHINDWIGVAASFHYTASVQSPLASSIESALPDKYTGEVVNQRQPSKQQFRDHVIGPNMLFSLYGVVTPMAGKFALFSSLFARYDFYGMLGFGGALLNTPLAGSDAYSAAAQMNNDVNKQSPDVFTGFRPGGMVGIGTHFYFNEWIGLQLELRDYFFKSNPGGLDVTTTDKDDAGNPRDNSPVLSSADEYITNNLYFGLGVTLMLPPGAKVSR